MPSWHMFTDHGLVRAPEDASGTGGGPVVVVGREITVLLENGLHMAPCGEIVKLADRLGCQITLQKGDNRVDGKSILDMLTLAAEKGQTLHVEVRGERSEEALHEVIDLLEGKSGHR